MKFWYEIFSKFLLDVSKMILTAFVIGKFVMPDLIGYWIFWCGILIVILVIFLAQKFAQKVGENV